MQTDEVTQRAEPGGGLEVFVPRGAIAFVAVMVVLYAAVWLAFYSILVGRA